MDVYGAEYYHYPAIGPNNTFRSEREITDFVIHHSAGNKEQTPAEIDKEHRARGMAMIAYNWVITPKGVIYTGRSTQTISAATFGRNPMSVSVCLIGNFQHDEPGYTGPPTPEQVQALKNLCLKAHVILPSVSRTYGHCDVAKLFYPDDPGPYATACPGNELYAMIPAVKFFVNEQLHSKL